MGTEQKKSTTRPETSQERTAVAVEKTFTVWVGNDSNIKDVLPMKHGNMLTMPEGVFVTRGSKYEWAEGWPPQKLRVTVTVEPA